MAFDGINYGSLPEHLQGGMRRYIEQGIEPGSFLQAALQNKLVEALGQADLISRACIFSVADFLYNQVPLACWGSEQKYYAWVHAKGRP
jgi:hypothetical protein